jgi:hypothetical protein
VAAAKKDVAKLRAAFHSDEGAVGHDAAQRTAFEARHSIAAKAANPAAV